MISSCMEKNESRIIICYGDSNTYEYDSCVIEEDTEEGHRIFWENIVKPIENLL